MRQLIFTTFLTLFQCYSNAQISEGYFQFSIDVEAIDTAVEVRQQTAMLRDSKMELYFSEGRYRIDYHLGHVSTTSIRVDTFKNEALSLTTGVMGNYAYKNTPDAFGFGQMQKDSVFDVQLFDEHTVILGFHCDKAVLERNGVRSTYWYTNEIQIAQQGVQLINRDIPGFPLSFTTIENGVRIHYEVSNYKFEIENKDEVFSTDPPANFNQIKEPTEE